MDTFIKKVSASFMNSDFILTENYKLLSKLYIFFADIVQDIRDYLDSMKIVYILFGGFLLTLIFTNTDFYFIFNCKISL